jgi:hypothetical protein
MWTLIHTVALIGSSLHTADNGCKDQSGSFRYVELRGNKARASKVTQIMRDGGSMKTECK